MTGSGSTVEGIGRVCIFVPASVTDEPGTGAASAISAADVLFKTWRRVIRLTVLGTVADVASMHNRLGTARARRQATF